MIYDNIVIGSGISALGCVVGLLQSNKKILCIDGSDNTLESFKNINNEEIVFDNDNLPLKKNSITAKFINKFDPIKVQQDPTFGGLSNIWGAKCLRLFKNQFDEWPISYHEIAKYYETCEKIMNVSHYNDELSKELGVNENIIDDSKIKLYSNFIKTFIKQKKSPVNFYIGLARLALDSKCYKCGNCFFGCPDNYIFNTKDYFNNLINTNQIEYKKNLILEKFILKDSLIELNFKNSQDTKIFTKKLFIGAGPIQTPNIIMNSMNKERNLNLAESQNYFVPCFYYGKDFDSNINNQTAGDAEIIASKNIKHNIGQLYFSIKYDQKLLKIVLKKKLGLLYKLIPNFLIKRIFIAAGLIDSDHSTYSAIIKKEDLSLHIIRDHEKEKKIRFEVSNQLNLLGKNYNFFAINLLSKFCKFGRSFRLGSSIPMLNEDEIKENKNNKLYTKKNGEISKFKNVYIIDSSNFKNIPAGDISLTIMANALRIAVENQND